MGMFKDDPKQVARIEKAGRLISPDARRRTIMAEREIQQIELLEQTNAHLVAVVQRLDSILGELQRRPV